jgi:HPt (histidine-containing phosphotransfer) domain-containing protein
MAPRTKELNERDAKLVQWLNEAHVKEAELESALAAHIGLTQKAAYKKRLEQHLKETREHKRAVARRIKALGGAPQTGPDLPGVPAGVGTAAGKTKAAIKAQVGAARALVTEQAETHIRNVQEELREEQVEIALYVRIETFCHRGRRSGHRDPGQAHPARGGADGQVPHRRAPAPGQGYRPGRCPTRPARQAGASAAQLESRADAQHGVAEHGVEQRSGSLRSAGSQLGLRRPLHPPLSDRRAPAATP